MVKLAGVASLLAHVPCMPSVVLYASTVQPQACRRQ